MIRASGPDTSFERELEALHGGPIAGVDEAGRGPWAGPVVTAAVCFTGRVPQGLNDSKKLTEARRDALFDEICACADVGIAFASPSRIDAMNIRAATLWAMVRAVKALPVAPGSVLVDGRDLPAAMPCPGRFLIKGDALSASVAAASIVAKVTRDRVMCRLGALLPGYGFEQHKGYGTALHAEALARLGVTVHHRRSFRPIRALLDA